MLDGVLFVAVLVILLVMGTRDRDTDHIDAWSFSPRVRPVPKNLQGLWLVRNLPPLATAFAFFAAVVFPFIVTRPSQQLLFSRVPDLCTHHVVAHGAHRLGGTALARPVRARGHRGVRHRRGWFVKG